MTFASAVTIAVTNALSKLLTSRTLKSPLPFAVDHETLGGMLELPKNPDHGDLAFPVFQLSKSCGAAPAVLATELAALVEIAHPITEVTPIGPYLNFKVSPTYRATTVITSARDGSLLTTRPSTGKRVMVEFGGLNTHKVMHVGHARVVTLGDSIARIVAWSGDSVIRANYWGDEGTHVATCLWHLLKQGITSIPQERGGEFLGLQYSAARQLTELSALTTFSHTGVLVAQVVAVRPHPSEATWSVITLSTKDGEKNVVSAATGTTPGMFVAHVSPGTQFGARAVGIVNKKGIESYGMILSEKEAGLSDNNDRVAALPAVSATVGQEVCELFAVAEKLLPGKGVLETHATRKAEVSDILKRIEAKDPAIEKLWLDTREISFADMRDHFAWLGASFDVEYAESQFAESSKEIVMDYYRQGKLIMSDGAIGADLSDEKLGFALLIKRDGTAMYACRDIGLAKKKFDDYPLDLSINVVDVGQSLHFKHVYRLVEMTGIAPRSKLHHVAYEIVMSPHGKFSSRKGDAVLFAKLRELTERKIFEEFLSKYQGDWSQEEITRAKALLARATIRYGMLQMDNNSVIVFDLDAWTSKTGNTGPYLMYAYARTRAIAREIGATIPTQIQYELLSHPHEQELLRKIESFSETVLRCKADYSLHHLCSYLFELSKLFNRWYAECSVKNAESPALRDARLALVDCTGSVLQRGLNLLGIETLERM